jgi:hypothetical protein
MHLSPSIETPVRNLSKAGQFHAPELSVFEEREKFTGRRKWVDSGSSPEAYYSRRPSPSGTLSAWALYSEELAVLGFGRL